ncbi:hypothetical protein BDV26DRAFT_297293 [Aspergillus bertholletiae]|uniref:Fungal N-terminal domain-containing protein n=1 Tax=Aspergillus bertholletiae TaxID=1226010 RepID=A0A5N7AT50_9EURO|nr:hypothetical protein BDV26DRAFT_297293 [Aspergillus bertholletiae]
MGDPFSVTTGAFGAISLGITVCGGIVKYCSAVEGADEEVSRIAQKAERMQKTMNLLNRLLQDSVSLVENDYIDHCREIIGIIQAGIDNLEAAVVRCWGDSQAARPAQSNMRYAAKKALYPFRQKALVSVNDALDSLQLELSTALHMAQTQIPNASTAAILAQNIGTHINMEQSIAILEKKLGNQNLTCPVSNHYCRCSTSTAASTHHSRSCCHNRSTHSSRNATKVFSAVCIFFGLRVSASISIFKEPRGLRLSPHLTFRATVPFDSPAFALVGKLSNINPNSTPEDVVSLVNTVIAQLHQLYDGKAHWCDVNPDGDSIMHKLCNLRPKFEMFPDAKPYYSQLISYFTNSHLLAEPNKHGFTPMDSFIGKAIYVVGFPLYSLADRILTLDTSHIFEGISQEMLRLGTVTEGIARFIGAGVRKKHAVNMVEQCLDISDFTWAMLCESQSALESAMESTPSCLGDYNGIMSSLQLAVSWIEGLEILLRKGEHSVTEVHQAMLNAIARNNLESVQLLLSVDVPFLLLVLNMHHTIEMQELLITEFTKRRAELRDLAESVLTSKDLASLELTKGQLPDRMAARLCTLLKDRGIAVPDRLSASEHFPILRQITRLSMMKALYQVGFQDKTSIAPPYRIHPEAALRRAMWLIDMDLNLKVSEGGFPTVLELCSRFTDCFTLMEWRLSFSAPVTCKHAHQIVANSFEALNNQQQQFWLDCLASNETDSCSCSCSPRQGCGAITCMLHSLFGRGNDTRDQLAMDDEYTTHACHFSFLFKLLIKPLSGCVESVRTVLRYLTFQELGLRHTCRKSHFSEWSEPWLSDEEIAEIHEEERLLLEDLEVLVAEFEHRYLELNLPLLDFLQGNWGTRMKEVLFKRRDPNLEIVKEAKQIGIALNWEPIDHVQLLFEQPCKYAPPQEETKGLRVAPIPFFPMLFL